MKLIALILGGVVSAQISPTIRPGTLTTGDIATIVAALPRFTPDRFVALPPSVREAFTAMACQVPQNALSTGPSNVIEGEFVAKGQRDWAALCSNGTTTEIRIVWGGATRCEDRLASRQDSDTIAATPPGTYAYARSIVLWSRDAERGTKATRQVPRYMMQVSMRALFSGPKARDPQQSLPRPKTLSVGEHPSSWVAGRGSWVVGTGP